MMRKMFFLALIPALAGTPVLAQTADQSSAGGSGHVGHTGIKPVDHGPYTKQANEAYQGGGMVLQGAPGAPAPQPQPTPPGQTPQNMVPQ